MVCSHVRVPCVRESGRRAGGLVNVCSHVCVPCV